MRSMIVLLAGAAALLSARAESNRGYYRYPAVHGETVVFTAEGDLWSVPLQGGVARRITTHPAEEFSPAFSPDGTTIAFSANYEGPTDVYTMPVAGGLPVRRTFLGDAVVQGWTPGGKIIVSTSRFATLPDDQLIIVGLDNRVERIPLSQAAQGDYDKTGATLFFTRLPFQGSHARRYQGGTAQNLWKYTRDASEAVPLTPDWAGTSKNAMWWNNRVYFVSDRDGVMNLWSMNESGKDLRQLTRHQGFDIKEASLGTGRIVYQLGADLRVYDIARNEDRAIPIELSSDFDNLREHWIKSPAEYLSSAHLSPDGSKVAFVSRGRAVVAPVKSGRWVEIPTSKPGRIRDARFLTRDTLLLLSTESGEVEFWKAPADGISSSQQLTSNGKVLRWEGVPSPDGKFIAHQDKNNQLWLLDIAKGTEKRIGDVAVGGNSNPPFDELRWSPDSRYLTYDTAGRNGLARIMLYSLESGLSTPLTSDRYDNHAASWSAGGKWLFFLSDRALKSLVQSPWGERQPDPYFDRTNKIYALALGKDTRFPFQPQDELAPDTPEDKTGKKDEKKEDKGDAKSDDKDKPPAPVTIDFEGLPGRLYEVPVPPGNYTGLAVAGERLCWLDHSAAQPDKRNLQCLDINNKPDNKPETIIEEITDFEVSANGKSILIRKEKEFYVIDSSAKSAALKEPKALSEARVDLSGWSFSVVPLDEYRETFYDAWRLHRDYFYDRNMHGINWTAMRDKYVELLPRVRDRSELNDLLASMVSELSALHTFVFGGDLRRGTDQVGLAALGALTVRDDAAGGYRIEHIYRSDPDRPDRASPLARPSVNLSAGDVITHIDGRSVLALAAPSELLRNKAGKQVRLRIKPSGKSETRDVIVTPFDLAADGNLRYHEWEYSRRLQVEEASAGKIGYVHLRAMGQGDIAQFVEEYTPVFTRQGLIIDVRHNGGGNIDSWILAKLMRKAWMYWQPRVGQVTWNMQNAFLGHMVVLCDEGTGSDGEAFSEGFRRLGLGKVIGTRTWGGEIWLTMTNALADHGIATAAEIGVFGPEGKWLIEGHGVVPDIVVDNLPHSTFTGKDAQLEAAIAHLQKLIRDKPVVIPAPPDYPVKTFTSGESRPTRRAGTGN